MAPFGSFFSRGLLLLVMALMYADAGKVFSLKEKVDLYVSDLAEEKGAEVLWWDMHGEHETLVKNAEYSRYKVNVAAGSIEYRSGEKVSDEDHAVKKKKFDNGDPTRSMVRTFNQTVKSVVKHSWTVESAFDYGKGPLVVKANDTVLMADGSTPEVSNDQSWDVDLTTDKEQSYNRTEWANFSSVVFTILPMKTMELEWNITSFSKELPWTSVVAVGGFFAVWFKTEVNGNNLWFCPVTVLEDPLLEHVRPEELEFVAHGRYKGVRTIETPAKLVHVPDYGGPQNVSTVNGTVAPPDFYDYAEVQLPPTGKPEATCEVARTDAVSTLSGPVSTQSDASSTQSSVVSTQSGAVSPQGRPVATGSGAVSFRTRSPILYIFLATNLLTMTLHVFP